MRKLRVKALAENLPNAIKINITKLGIGDSIKVEQMQQDNLEFLDNKSNLIVGVISTRLAKGSALPEDEEEEKVASDDVQAPESNEPAE